MGMLSRAMRPSRFPMTMEEWYLIRNQEQVAMARTSPPLRDRNITKYSDGTITQTIGINQELLPSLERMAEERGISVEKLINIRLQAMVFSFDNGRALSLKDPMPFGQYRGIILEDLIRADGRYVRWLYGTSEIFELTEDARAFLEEMS